MVGLGTQLGPFLTGILVAVIGYLLGGVPFALIIGKATRGVDLRTLGSGNLGATNAYRQLGAGPGLAVLALDAAKGAAAVGFAMLAGGVEWRDWILPLATLAAMLGHSYSPYLRFYGGKGVATAAGAVLIVTPLVWPILLLVFVLVAFVSRRISLGSIVIAALFPFLVWTLYPDRPVTTAFAAAAAALVVWRHRGNIARLARGEESKVRFPWERATDAPARVNGSSSGPSKEG